MGAEGQDWIRGGAENAARQVVLGGELGAVGRQGWCCCALSYWGSQRKALLRASVSPRGGDAALLPPRAAVRTNKIGVSEALGAPPCCILGKASPERATTALWKDLGSGVHVRALSRRLPFSWRKREKKEKIPQIPANGPSPVSSDAFSALGAPMGSAAGQGPSS